MRCVKEKCEYYQNSIYTDSFYCDLSEKHYRDWCNICCIDAEIESHKNIINKLQEVKMSVEKIIWDEYCNVNEVKFEGFE